MIYQKLLQKAQKEKSQINNYDKNCGLFQQYILENIIPIVI